MAKKTIHTLEEIYPESAVTAQRERYEKSAEEFRSIFGDSDQLRYFSAPGRTEVGGNHTDHNRGRVLAAAVNLDTVAAVAARAASEKLVHGPQKVIIKGQVYYSQTISFYENDEFDYALGCATIFFDEEGVPVGLKDIYDFNEAKHRDTNAESDTTFMAKFEKANLAKSYAILYGINDYDLHD